MTTRRIWPPSAPAKRLRPTDGTAYDVLAWRGLDRGVETMVLGADAAGIPDTLDAVRHRAPAWSDDGHMISLGLRPIEPEAGDDADEGGADESGDGPGR